MQRSGSPDVARQAGAPAWWARLRAARWLWVVLLSFGLTRLGIALVAYVAEQLIINSTVPMYHLGPPGNLLLDVFASRWDTGFYLSIADVGYRYQGVPLPSVAFFPLLPLLIRAATPLAGSPLVAGLLVTNMALLGAMLLLHRLVSAEWGDSVADRAVWYMLIFPASFFGSAIYSESLFLFTAIGAFYLARRGSWESAVLLGVAATLTRLVGVILAPVLLVEWLIQRRQAPARAPLPALLGIAAVPLGTAGYMLYLQRMFGDPLAFMQASAAWAREPRSPLALMTELLQPPAEGWGAALLAGHLPLDNWIDLLAALLFVGLGGVLLARRRWSEAALVLLGALLPLGSGLLMSQRRYVWVLFPAFILLAQWGERPWVDRAITLCSLLGLGLAVALFANGYWVG